MILPLLYAAAILILYRYLSKRSERALWRSSVAVGTAAGTMRGLLACLGYYVVEHTGGWLQIPALLLAMLAWPDAILLASGRHPGPTPWSFYLKLALLLIVTSILLVCGVALVVQVARGRQPGEPRPARPIGAP